MFKYVSVSDIWEHQNIIRMFYFLNKDVLGSINGDPVLDLLSINIYIISEEVLNVDLGLQF